MNVDLLYNVIEMQLLYVCYLFLIFSPWRHVFTETL